MLMELLLGEPRQPVVVLPGDPWAAHPLGPQTSLLAEDPAPVLRLAGSPCAAPRSALQSPLAWNISLILYFGLCWAMQQLCDRPGCVELSPHLCFRAGVPVAVHGDPHCVLARPFSASARAGEPRL